MGHLIELESVPNLGAKSVRMLAGAGITTEQQLRDIGPVVAFLAVRQSGRRPSLNLLWAIAAGLQNRHWTDLSAQEKQKLRDQMTDWTR